MRTSVQLILYISVLSTKFSHCFPTFRAPNHVVSAATLSAVYTHTRFRHLVEVSCAAHLVVEPVYRQSVDDMSHLLVGSYPGSIDHGTGGVEFFVYLFPLLQQVIQQLSICRCVWQEQQVSYVLNQERFFCQDVN